MYFRQFLILTNVNKYLTNVKKFGIIQTIEECVMSEFIQASELYKTYRSGGVETNALCGADFAIRQGAFTVVLGPSGAGKTTLLNLMGGMDTVTSGSLVVDGRNLYGLKRKELTAYRRTDVGFVFQFYNLMPNLTALENVELAVELCKDAFSPSELLQKVGLSERARNFPSQLSGGEQQRVSIARAIAKNPKLLLCDEPTGALDYNTGKAVLQLLFDMSRTEQKTVIIVTHNAALKDMADQVIHIKNGAVANVEFNPDPKNISEIEW